MSKEMSPPDDSYTLVAHREAQAEQAEANLRLRLGALRAAMDAVARTLPPDGPAPYRSESERPHVHTMLRRLQEEVGAVLAALQAYGALADRAEEGRDRTPEP